MPRSKQTPKKLTPRQRLFVLEITKDPRDKDATAAAIRAGFKERSAKSTASRMLTHDNFKHVQDAIEEKTLANEARVDISTDRIARELALIAFSDPAHYMEIMPDGTSRVLSFDEMDPEARRALKSVSATHKIKEVVAGEGDPDKAETVILYSSVEYAHHDKMKALELLGKHKKMFIEVKEVRGDIDLITPTGLQKLGEVLREVVGK